MIVAPKISVIVPVYNAEKYLHRCLDSILNQKFEDFEVLLVDDGSTDLSFDICSEYVKKDNRFHVFSISNHGVSYARNYGMSKSVGEFICFIDSDDFIEKNYCLDFFSKCLLEDNISYDITIQGSKKKIVEKNKVVINKVTESSYCKENVSSLDILELEKRYAINTVWGKMFRSSIIKNNNLCFNESISYGEDHIFLLEYCRYILNIKVLDATGYCYFIRKNNSLSQKRLEIELQLNFIEGLSDARSQLYSDTIFNNGFIYKHFKKLYRRAFCSLLDIDNSDKKNSLYKKILKSYSLSKIYHKNKLFSFFLMKDRFPWSLMLYCNIITLLKKTKSFLKR